MKKMNYKKSIILGFLTVYVLSMIFSTKMIEDNYKLRHNSLIYKDFVRKGVSTGFTYVSKFRNILGTFLKNVYLCT